MSPVWGVLAMIIGSEVMRHCLKLLKGSPESAMLSRDAHPSELMPAVQEEAAIAVSMTR